MADQLTPVQRQRSLKEIKKLDRLPVVLFDNIIAAKLAGMTYPESESTPENIARKAVLSYKTFGHDDVSIVYGIHGFGTALGSRTKDSDEAPPSLVEYALNDTEDLKNLDFESALFENEKRQQDLFKAMELIQKEVGSEVYSRFCICAPFTAAAGILNPETLLRSTRKKKEKVHELLRLMTDLSLKMIDKFQEIENLVFHISDPVASGSLISPKQYEEFCQPYTRELVERIQQYKKPVTLHICGDTTKLLDMIAETGIDYFSIDQEVDLAFAKEKIGDKVILLGNVDPVEVLMLGTPEEIEAEVKDCFVKTSLSPQGFVIGPGCDVPYGAPIENIQTYIESAKKYAKWTVHSLKH